MNKMMTKASLLAVALIVALPFGLAAQDEGYYAGSYARLSYVNGAVYIERTAGLGYEKGEVNLALVQGDRIGTEIGQAEIHFGRRNYLRLYDNTKVEFVLLPSEGQERIKLHLTSGSAFLRVSELAIEKGVELHTPDASFYVLDAGLYRFDVRPGGETQAFAREGSLEAAAEDGSAVVRDGETVTAADGRFLNDPEYASAPSDAFDEWNGGRDALLTQRSERQYLPSGIDEYEEELDQNGYWVYERPYGNVWVPYAASYDDWRPYSHGRWVWYPVAGWTWVPSEPWGWAVYHYGRWNWRFGLGWYWIPTHRWGPAWVHWWSDGLYVGWCPLTWYNRPAYLFHDRFYDRWNDRYFSAHNRALTVIRRDHLQDRDVGRRHLASNDLDRIGQVELRDRQPAIRPAVDNARPQAIAARRALADPSGARGRVNEIAPSRSMSPSRLRSGAGDAGVRSGERATVRSYGDAGRGTTARPSVRNDGSGGGSVRTFPSRRETGGRSGNGVAEYRRGAVAQPDRSGSATGRSNEGRVVRSQDREAGASRPATVREPQRSQSSGNERSGSATRHQGTVKSDPPARSGSSVKSSAGRSQSRSYAPSASVTRSPARVTGPAPRSSTQPSLSGRAGSSRPSASSTSPRGSGPSFSRPRTSGPSSTRSYAPPRSSGSTSSRSFSAPRSGGSSSGRSVSAPRSGGSSSRSAVRSSGSASSGRSGSSGRSSSSGSKSSGSSSRSGSARRKN